MSHNNKDDIDPAVDTKADVIHAEGNPIPVLNDDGLVKGVPEAQMKSAYDSLSTRQAVSLFAKTVSICTVAGFCAATDGKLPSSSGSPVSADIAGYQHQLTASIIANKGFIQTFAPPALPRKLDPAHVSAWGGIYR